MMKIFTRQYDSNIGSNRKGKKMKRLLMVVMCVLVFVSCGGNEFRTCITTERCTDEHGRRRRKKWERGGLKYELRFDGVPVSIVHGDTLIHMTDDIECVAVKLLECGSARLEMSMSRSCDNELFFGGIRCVGVADVDTIGVVTAVCRSMYGTGCE